ncbi:amino acid adenylation domain-containing protein [Paenibacillus polymyxa]|uniref:non-ribosomal peptide synthetase n=1 Tax=Paenibacillus polymyxa TaxID=1406 RepID=UPI001BE7CCD2|nr:non-ribosomal peptide synthetase [Paenibacillus polymyxa]MBT2287431.1 amino acid adenylation domain-containing protein [Paenibacillus polymyxa]
MGNVCVDLHPLTEHQQRIWYMEMLYPNSDVWMITAKMSIPEPINFILLEQSINRVLKNKELLRTRIILDQGEKKQYIQPYKYRSLKHIHEGPALTDMTWTQYVDNHPIHVHSEDLCQIYTYEGHGQYGYIIQIHHIICDGLGLVQLTNEITETYHAELKGGNTGTVESATHDYENYVHSEQQYFTSKRYAKDQAFWREKFHTIPEFMELKPHNPLLTHTAARRKTMNMDHSMYVRLKEFCRQKNVSVFTFFLSNLAILLNKLTHHTDLVVGTNYANRTSKTDKDMIGMFVTTIPVRIEVEPSESVLTLLQRISNEQKEMLRHQKYPYNQLIRELREWLSKPELNRLFGISLVYRPESFKKMQGHHIDLDNKFNGHETNDLLINIIEKMNEDRIIFQLDYRTELFSETFMDNVLNQFLAVTEAILEQSELRIEQISIVSEADKQSMLTDFNNTEAVYPSDKTVIQLFEEQAAATPQHTALILGDKEMNYEQLNARANGLATALISRGIKQRELVGIIASHSMEMVIAILAVMKAGCAYIPIDPEYPDGRIQHILKDSQVRFVLVNQRIEMPDSVDVIHLLEDRGGQIITDNLNLTIDMRDLAYVIYTSGSTGAPKGVLVEHKGLTNYIWWSSQAYVADRTTTFSLYSSISFDLTVTSVFTPLITGNAVIIYNSSHNKALIAEVVLDPRVDLIKLTPAHLQLIQDMNLMDRSNVRTFIVGGDNLSASLAANITRQSKHEVTIFNEYGPTETVVGCMIYTYNPHVDLTEYVPIGRPIQNTSIYVLDQSLRYVPVGVQGELLVGGDGVTRGYLNQPELTGRKYVEHPDHPGERLYRTGDLCRLREDGQMEYLGRMDDQVKIRGYRIELGEVKAAFLKIKGVRDVAVSVKTDQHSRQLCAYYVSDVHVTRRMVRDTLVSLLPEYMVPTHLIKVSSIPLTINGKIDYLALSIEKPQSDEENVYVAPSSVMEQTISAIWSEILGLEEVGVTDHFYERGGDSLKLIQIYTRLCEIGFDFSINDMFNFPTIQSLSSHLDQVMEGKAGKMSMEQNTMKRSKVDVLNGIMDKPIFVLTDIPRVDPALKGVMSFNQESLWLVEQFEGKSTKYNIPGHIIFEGTFSEDAYIYALNQIVQRHDVLRTYFVIENNIPVQRIRPYEPFNIEVQVSLSDASEASLKRVIEEESRHQFNLEKGPMYYFRLYQIHAHQYFAYFNFHHIIFDGWSQDILMVELGSFYNAYLRGENAATEDLTIQYSDYSYWQKEKWMTAEFPTLLDYWRNQLGSTVNRSVKVLPYDREPSLNNVDTGDILLAEIPIQTIEMIKKAGMKNNASLYITMLTAYKILLYFYSGEIEIVVGTPVANRNRAEVQRLIGYFSNSLALKTVMDPEQSIDAQIISVRNTVFEAFDHQEMPFGKLIELLNPDRASGLTPFFQTWFVLDVKNTYNIEGLSIAQNEILWGHSGKSKWDLTLNLIEADHVMNAVVEYKTELFGKSTMKRFLHDYMAVVELIAADSSRSLQAVRHDWEVMAHEYKMVLLNSSKSKKKFNKIKS